MENIRVFAIERTANNSYDLLVSNRGKSAIIVEIGIIHNHLNAKPEKISDASTLLERNDIYPYKNLKDNLFNKNYDSLGFRFYIKSHNDKYYYSRYFTHKIT